jgi:predicted nucleic acid-binding protein
LATFTALYDACVLYPAPLRDLLMELAVTDLFRAKWSQRIHDEWTASLLKNRPDLTAADLKRTREFMDMSVRDCVVENFEELIPSLHLPDSKDNHVLAAAIKGRGDVIVTYNLKDFPAKELGKYDIAAQHPDEFLTHVVDLAPGIVSAACRTHRNRLKNPAKSVEEYLECLEKQQLNEFVAKLRAFANLL